MNDKLERALTEYERLCSAEDENLDLVELRSGTTYSRTHSTMTKSEDKTKTSDPKPGSSKDSEGPKNPKQGSTKDSESPMFLRVLPSQSKVPPFSGTDAGYSVRKFVSSVEDVLKTSHLVDDREKIAFFRAQIQPGSFAHNLLDACTLSRPADEGDYEVFKNNFVETFEDVPRENIVKGLHHVTQKLKEAAGSSTRLEALIPATKLTEDLEKLLDSGGWLDHDNLSRARLRKFLQLFLYVHSLKADERKGILSLEFSPDDDLHKFSLKLKTKMQEKGLDATQVISKIGALPKVVSTSNETPTVAAAFPSDSSNSLTRTDKLTGRCHLCRKEGHFIAQCPERNVDKGRKPFVNFPTKNFSSFNKPRFVPNFRNTGTRPKTYHPPSGQSVRNQGTYPSKKIYCSFHESNTHSTDDCFTVKQLKQQHRQSGDRGKTVGSSTDKTSVGRTQSRTMNNSQAHTTRQSGEEQRPVQHPPG